MTVLPSQNISPGCIHTVLLLAEKEPSAPREKLPGLQVRAVCPIPSSCPSVLSHGSSSHRVIAASQFGAPSVPSLEIPLPTSGLTAAMALLGCTKSCLVFPHHSLQPNTGVRVINLNLKGFIVHLVPLSVINIM